MKCRGVVEQLAVLVDAEAAEAPSQALREHLGQCPKCSATYFQMHEVRSVLSSMPVHRPPAQLAAKLRAIATEQRITRGRNFGWQTAIRQWADNLRVHGSNMMRPFALPVAGGLVSAVFLFMMLAPMYGLHGTQTESDVPTILTTKAALMSSTLSFGLIQSDIVVEVIVDGQGRMVDYSVPLGQGWELDPVFRKDIENTLLCTQFKPATMFGLPRSSKLRITLRGNQVEVRG
jgi:hypothetical protein